MPRRRPARGRLRLAPEALQRRAAGQQRDRADLEELHRERADQREQAELLRADADDQRREAVLGDVVGRLVEIGIALAVVEADVRQQLVGRRLVLRQVGKRRRHRQRQVAVTAEHERPVVHAVVLGVRGRALVADDRRPHEPVRGRVVRGRLRPADHLGLRKTALLAPRVVFLGAGLQALQQLVGLPVLRVVVADIAARLERHDRDPVGIGIVGQHEADQLGFVDRVAHRAQVAAGFGSRHERFAGFQLQHGFVFHVDVGRLHDRVVGAAAALISTCAASVCAWLVVAANASVATQASRTASFSLLDSLECLVVNMHGTGPGVFNRGSGVVSQLARGYGNAAR